MSLDLSSRDPTKVCVDRSAETPLCDSNAHLSLHVSDAPMTAVVRSASASIDELQTIDHTPYSSGHKNLSLSAAAAAAAGNIQRYNRVKKAPQAVASAHHTPVSSIVASDSAASSAPSRRALRLVSRTYDKSRASQSQTLASQSATQRSVIETGDHTLTGSTDQSLLGRAVEQPALESVEKRSAEQQQEQQHRQSIATAIEEESAKVAQPIDTEASIKQSAVEEKSIAEHIDNDDDDEKEQKSALDASQSVAEQIASEQSVVSKGEEAQQIVIEQSVVSKGGEEEEREEASTSTANQIEEGKVEEEKSALDASQSIAGQNVIEESIVDEKSILEVSNSTAQPHSIEQSTAEEEEKENESTLDVSTSIAEQSAIEQSTVEEHQQKEEAEEEAGASLDTDEPTHLGSLECAPNKVETGSTTLSTTFSVQSMNQDHLVGSAIKQQADELSAQQQEVTENSRREHEKEEEEEEQANDCVSVRTEPIGDDEASELDSFIVSASESERSKPPPKPPVRFFYAKSFAFIKDVESDAPLIYRVEEIAKTNTALLHPLSISGFKNESIDYDETNTPVKRKLKGLQVKEIVDAPKIVATVDKDTQKVSIVSAKENLELPGTVHFAKSVAEIGAALQFNQSKNGDRWEFKWTI